MTNFYDVLNHISATRTDILRKCMGV